jgi:hypothetical protein
MNDYRLTSSESDILKVIKNEIDTAQNALSLRSTIDALDVNIASSTELLRSLGFEDELAKIQTSANNQISSKPAEKKIIEVRTFEDLLNDANERIPNSVDFTDIFSTEELAANREVIEKLNEDFNAIHRLDGVDWAICVIAGLVAAAIDILLVGIPGKTADGTKAGSLSDWIRRKFDEALPPEKIKELEESAKVPYDPSMNTDNQGNPITDTYVNGLTPYFHRLVSLGHDPLLGLIFGVLDVLKGTMTTIDRKGKIVRQIMPPPYGNRTESSIIEALKKVIRHMKSDVNTSMGLPAPMMALFNLFQFGKIGDQEQTIAEIVQGMYYDGYDFIHFCSMSIPVIISEFGVRIPYAIKRIKEGYSIKDSIPVTTNREKRPKLGTMLFTAHTVAAAVNAGKVIVAANTGVDNPFLAINYPQWLAFIKHSIQQLKWVLFTKPNMRHKYVMGIIDDEWASLYEDIDELWSVMSDDYTFLYDG